MNPNILEPEFTPPPSTIDTAGSPRPYGPTPLPLSCCLHPAANQSTRLTVDSCACPSINPSVH